MSNETIRFAEAMRWEGVRWEDVRRARAVALACRVDRRLQEASEAASRPEMGLADSLRRRLRRAATDGGPVERLLDVVAVIHEQLDHLPKPPLPAGLRVFFDELLGPERSGAVVIAPTAKAVWPDAAWVEAAEDPVVVPAEDLPYPVAVIPQAELSNPLMWPLVGRQAAAALDGQKGMDAVSETVGPAMGFARAEALLAVDEEAARELWEEARSELTPDAFAGAWRLARQLADGVLISAHRTGRDPRRGGAADGHPGAQNPVYDQLAAAYDEPASAADILHAGWFHWYGEALGAVVALALRGEDGFDELGRLVNGIDDLLCRSLDVAAIHRFYTSGEAKA